MQQRKINYQPIHMAPSPQDSMGSILIEELHQAIKQVDFEGMLSRSSHLARFAKNNSKSQLLINDLKAMADSSPLACLAAIESVSQMHHVDATKLLIDCLSHSHIGVRRQATWKLASSAPTSSALPMLLQHLCVGGIDTMHAHHTLEKWAKIQPELIAEAVNDALLTQKDDFVRARIVDLLGILKAPNVMKRLAHLACDTEEAAPVRIAAISALGSASSTRLNDFTDSIKPLLKQLATQKSEIAAYATLALHDQSMQQCTPISNDNGHMRVCQMVLAKMDKNLSHGGFGETGGVASLLVSLSDALAAQPAIGQVLTIGLGSIEEAINNLSAHRDTPQPFRVITAGNALRPMDSSNAWEHLPLIKRSIKRCLSDFGGVDLIHLRMLDAGTFAAASVAHELGIPVCFSFAPDPQNTVQALTTSQQLTQQALLNADAQGNLWFRARMLEKMARTARQMALFPQPKCALLLQDIRKDLSPHTQQSATIAEGIDVKLIGEAALSYANNTTAAVIEQLAQSIPPSRRHLPLLLSVGRFHPIKGMARIVTAWAGNPLLHDTCNLVLVGGNLANPSTIEAAVMQAIDKEVPIDDARRAGLIMLGGRPRADAALLMVATMMGKPDYWAAGGIYVDGAPKEEFGLALIEALATGLVVVAPSTGGPSTFVDHGDTGILVDPDHDFGQCISQGFALVERAGRILKARTMVEQHYAIDTMAQQLTSLYLTVKDNP